jgi:hypothetical protein
MRYIISLCYSAYEYVINQGKSDKVERDEKKRRYEQSIGRLKKFKAEKGKET